MNTKLLHRAQKVKPADRRYRPAAVALEERCTPTVGTLAVFGVTPGLGGAGSLSIAGLIGESSATAAATAVVSFQVTDNQGHVLASGPLTAQPLLSGLNLLAVKATVPVSVPPGSSETITLRASDADSEEGFVTASTVLFVSPIQGQHTLGFEIVAPNGDVYEGSGQGSLVVTQPSSGGFVARGHGSVQIVSAAHNSFQLNAAASGSFVFGIGHQGNIGLQVTGGRASINVGSFAGQTGAHGGLSATAAGSLNFVRYADSSISVSAHGSIVLAAHLNSTSTTNPAPSTLIGRGHNITIGLKTDALGHFQFGLSGRLKLSGFLNTSSLGALLG